MLWFKKAWEWVRDHWQIVVGALVALIGGFLAWGAYNRKVGKLKDAVEVEHAVSEVKRLEAKSEVLKKQEKIEEKKDKVLEQKIVKTKKKAVKARENVDERTDQEIADRFNELYR
jgi:hypothetical protein